MIEMIKVGSQDRFLGVECLRLRQKEKESSWSIDECLQRRRHSEIALPAMGDYIYIFHSGEVDTSRSINEN